MKRGRLLGLLSIAFLVSLPRQSFAEAPKRPTKETELVVWRYESLIMQGALLSPQGWDRASRLLDRFIPYPNNGPIRVMWTPKVIGEDWVKGNRAQVESKWTDDYGSIDAKLRYHPQDLGCPSITIYDLTNVYELTRSDTRNAAATNSTATQVPGAMEWKIVGPNARAATIEHVISYLKQRREQTHDLLIKKNATRSIASLQHLLNEIKRGRGASAC